MQTSELRSALRASTSGKPRITRIGRDFWRVQFVDNHTVIGKGFRFMCTVSTRFGGIHKCALVN